MAKKKKRDKQAAATSLPERLLKALQTGESGGLDLSSAGLDAEASLKAFAAAAKLLAKGPDPRRIVELPEVFQLAFLSQAEADEDGDLIGDVALETSSREVKKAARTLAHRLRSQGVDVDVPEESGTSVLERAVVEEERPLHCYLSMISAGGSRLLLLAKYTHGGVAVHQIELNDIDGLASFQGGTVGRSRYRKLFAANKLDELLEIDYAEGRALLAAAVDQRRKAGKPLPDEYLEASAALGEVAPAAATDPALDFPAERFAATPELADGAGRLLELEEFAMWIPDEACLKALAERIDAAKTSELVISHNQRVERIQMALDSGVSLILPDAESRTRYHARLLSAASFLKRKGQNSEAELAAAAAWQLLREGVEPQSCHFFQAMVKRVTLPAEAIAATVPDAGQPNDEPPAPPDGNLIVAP